MATLTTHRLALGGGILGASLTLATMTFAASTSGIGGTYVAVGAHRGSMTIVRKEDRIRIELQGGATVSDTASVAGDCEAVAEGVLTGAVVRARLVPFEGDVTSLDAEGIGRMSNAVVVVKIEHNVAYVRGTFEHCGLQNALNGKYRRRTTGETP